jgi:hypothetical protein
LNWLTSSERPFTDTLKILCGVTALTHWIGGGRASIGQDYIGETPLANVRNGSKADIRTPSHAYCRTITEVWFRTIRSRYFPGHIATTVFEGVRYDWQLRA